ncbi:M67 family metallopeptidase [Candidatus Cyanaurora vandensis]|uniref:M67 family metallopeptidase n=1 Tax=Candidatus Cyanaurora vandensis TaxID=2714958 RepID=UPI00257C8B0E|nr:M67 family metallopeptidase [Candidatus Cyanaurora vandensis]
MTLYLTPAHDQAIRDHGSQSYPDECCGLLLGKALPGEDKQLMEVWPVANVWAEAENDLADGESARRRYLIPPQAILEGEQHARAQGLEIVGYYHSHPDHPARPSGFDQDFAWPWYSYLIVSVVKGASQELTSWVLDDEREFRAEPLRELPSG